MNFSLSSLGQAVDNFWHCVLYDVPLSCRASLQRLGIQKAGLYMQHWPGFVTNGWCNDAFVEGLGDCALQGLTQAVGVSNFTAERVRHASSILEVRLWLLCPAAHRMPVRPHGAADVTAPQLTACQ